MVYGARVFLAATPYWTSSGLLVSYESFLGWLNRTVLVCIYSFLLFWDVFISKIYFLFFICSNLFWTFHYLFDSGCSFDRRFDLCCIRICHVHVVSDLFDYWHLLYKEI